MFEFLKYAKEMEGKVVRGVSHYGSTLIIRFADETYIEFHINYGYYDDPAEIDIRRGQDDDRAIDPADLFNMHVISKDEKEQMEQEKIRRQKQRDKDRRRRQYEAMKREFEGE